MWKIDELMERYVGRLVLNMQEDSDTDTDEK